MKRKTSPKILKASLIVLLVIVGIGLTYFCFENLFLDCFNNKVAVIEKANRANRSDMMDAMRYAVESIV